MEVSLASQNRDSGQAAHLLDGPRGNNRLSAGGFVAPDAGYPNRFRDDVLATADADRDPIPIVPASYLDVIPDDSSLGGADISHHRPTSGGSEVPYDPRSFGAGGVQYDVRDSGVTDPDGRRSTEGYPAQRASDNRHSGVPQAYLYPTPPTTRTREQRRGGGGGGGGSYRDLDSDSNGS